MSPRIEGQCRTGGPIEQTPLPYPTDPTLTRRPNRDRQGADNLLTTHGIREAAAAGQGVHAIAERFGVTLNAVRHVINGGTL